MPHGTDKVERPAHDGVAVGKSVGLLLDDADERILGEATYCCRLLRIEQDVVVLQPVAGAHGKRDSHASGTGGRGRVVKVAAGASPFVLFDADEAEIVLTGKSELVMRVFGLSFDVGSASLSAGQEPLLDIADFTHVNVEAVDQDPAALTTH